MDNRLETSVASRKVDSSMTVPSQDLSAVGACSQVATQAPMTASASHQGSAPAVAKNYSERVIDGQGRKVEISDLLNSISDTYKAVAAATDKNTWLKHLQRLIHLVEEAIGLPVGVPTDIGRAAHKASKKRIRMKLEKIAEKLNGTHPDLKHFRNIIPRLFKRWDLESKFGVARAACDRLFSGPPEDYPDQQLAEIEAFLEDANPDDIKDFLPASVIITWLEFAATRLGSGASKEYRLRVSNLMLDLKRQLEDLIPPVARQATEDHETQTNEEEDAQKQPNTQTNKQVTAGEGIQEAAKESNRSPIEQSSVEYDGPPGQGIGQANDCMEGPEQHHYQKTHIGKGPDEDSSSLNPHPLPHLDSDNSGPDTAQGLSASGPQSLDQRPGSEERASRNSLSEVAEMNASDKGQQDQVQPGKGESQRAKKRKHWHTGPSMSMKSAHFAYKRPRTESTSKRALCKGEGSEEHGVDRPLRSLRPRHYSEDEDPKPKDKQAQDTSEEGQPEDTGNCTQDTQALHIQIERALTRNPESGSRRIAEIDVVSKTVSTFLGPADESLLSQYIEHTRDTDTVKGEGNTQYKWTYYHKMATLSFYMLYKTPIRIRNNTPKKPKYLSAQQVIDIIKEVFVQTFPTIFMTLVEALDGVQKKEYTDKLTSSLRQDTSLPQGFLKIQAMLHELDNLKSTTLRPKIRHQRLLFELCTVYNAVLDHSADTSNIDTDLQSIITDIRDYTYTTHITSQTKKAKAKTKLAELLFPDTTDRNKSSGELLQIHKRNSDVVVAMIQTFSIGCIWMRPKPQATAWTGLRSGLTQIFNIIRQCDPDGRVRNICQSLERFTMAYTDPVPSVDVDTAMLDGLHEDPLQCLIRLIGDDARVPSRIEEQYSP